MQNNQRNPTSQGVPIAPSGSRPYQTGTTSDVAAPGAPTNVAGGTVLPTQPGAAQTIQFLPPQLLSFAGNPPVAAASVASQLFPTPSTLLNQQGLMSLPQLLANTTAAALSTANTPTNVTVPGIASVMGTEAVANGFHSNDHQNATAGGGTLGGVPIPSLPPHSSTAMQVQVAAAAAAAAAAPLKGGQGTGKGSKKGEGDGGRSKAGGVGVNGKELTPEEKARQNRDRNREHARSTRLRKKAYINKLKELVDGLHAERTEEVRKRRVAVQHLSEVQNVRRSVVRNFLHFHSSYESDSRKWITILEDKFWFKQPITPYRSFRRVEIEQECRVSRGVEAVLADSASLSVMVEGIGSRSARWIQIKRDDFLIREDARTQGRKLPHSIPSTRVNQAISSLSSSGSSQGSGSEEDRSRSRSKIGIGNASDPNIANTAPPNTTGQTRQQPSNDFHDYNAPSLPDPKLDSGSGESDSQNSASRKNLYGDSSSGDEDKMVQESTGKRAAKRRRPDPTPGHTPVPQPPPAKRSDVTSTATAVTLSTAGAAPPKAATISVPNRSGLPCNIAKKGGISHNIRPVLTPIPTQASANPRLQMAPAIALPPFVGIGKRAPLPAQTTPIPTPASSTLPAQGPPTLQQPPSQFGTSGVSVDTTKVPSINGQTAVGSVVIPGPAKRNVNNPSVTGNATVIVPDNDTNSSINSSSNQLHQIQAYYHVNEDDMLLTDDVLMCPFIFRSQDAVLCGALAECVMPGMLRAHFSSRNKLMNLEIVYDAMGFMQQLERASGSEGTAQIVPSSLEMALFPNANEARVITLAKNPYLIVSVNDVWTKMTNYTQMEVEGKEITILHGTRTDPEAHKRPGKPSHAMSEVATGKCACSVNVYYDKDGRDFVAYVCSYPLTNTNDDITHLLHIFKELPSSSSPEHEFGETQSSRSAA